MNVYFSRFAEVTADAGVRRRRAPGAAVCADSLAAAPSARVRVARRAGLLLERAGK
jgi:hypothetical protein